MDLSLFITAITVTLAVITVVIHIIQLCFFIFFESSKKEK